jgi:hypothetical protein
MTGSVLFKECATGLLSHEKRGIEMVGEKVLDVVKWSLIIAIGAIAFYAVCPKYDFIYYEKSGVYFRENTITGEIDLQYMGQGEVTFWKAKKPFVLF